MPKFEVQDGTIDVEQLGSGPDLIVLHSLLTGREAFREVVPTLANSWTVNLIDLPGFGGSTPTTPTIESFADRIAGLFPMAGFSEDSAVLGNGLGAFVALALAARHGHRFDRLVLLGAATGFPPEGRDTFRALAERARAGGMESIADAAVRRTFPDEFIAAHPDLADERRRVLLEIDPESFAGACGALSILDLSPTLPGVANPTMLVVGELDAATPPMLGRAVVEAISDASLIELPGCGHCPQLEQPGSLLAALAPFLDLSDAA
ncbi:MAG: alpha/beta fold hydrolase [Acidimicrobiia bacterium]